MFAFAKSLTTSIHNLCQYGCTFPRYIHAYEEMIWVLFGVWVLVMVRVWVWVRNAFRAFVGQSWPFVDVCHLCWPLVTLMSKIFS